MKNIVFISLLFLCSFMPQKIAFHTELDDVLAKAKKISEMMNDTPNKNSAIHKSTLGSPKNNIVFYLIIRF